MPQQTLSSEQTKAIKHGDGPLLIIAGAGTGKTTVITERIKHLIFEKNILPSEILALTFTEKAATEMEERIDTAMPYGYTQMWISTFHAFCDRILRSEAIHIGLNPSYKLMTEAETIFFLQKNIFKFKLDYFRPLGNPNKFLEALIQHFSRLKDEDVSPDQYLDWAQIQNSKFKTQSSNEKLDARRYPLDADGDEIKKTMELAKAFKTYEELKIKEGIMDFSDLVSNVLKLLRTRQNILKQYQNQFKYVLVDEFQDTNFAQNELAILLSGKQENITVVGDDDQAIYRWRGAAISNILYFKNRFPDAEIVTLTKNYRSTQEILDKSYSLIQNNNPDRLETKENIDKKLISKREKKGEPLEFIFTKRVEQEAEIVAKKIEELVDSEKRSYKDFAILVRANDHSLPFIKVFERMGLPYQFLGPGKLFHQEEIKDLIAYLKFLYNIEDSASLYRVLNQSIFQLYALDIATLLSFAKRQNLTLFEMLKKVSEEKEIQISLKDDSKEKIKKIVEMVEKHLSFTAKDSAGQILFYFLQDSGLLLKMASSNDSVEETKYLNIAKFFDKLKTFESQHDDASIYAVVDWIELSMQMGESPLAADIDWSDNNAINILTIHSSKGLEFPVVFLVNLITGRFPTRERKETIPIPQELIKETLPTGDFHLQEERRLFYVGLTRARDRLFLTASNFYGEGKRERKISPFVYETLSDEIVNKIQNNEKTKKEIYQPSLLEWSKSKPGLSPLTSHLSPRHVPINYLSYSQIQTFDICPLHYKLRYLLKIPSKTSAALSFGTSLHSALRDFYQQQLREEKEEVKHIHKILEKVWIKEGYTSKIHESQALQSGKTTLEKYLENNFSPDFKDRKPIALEVPFQFYINNLNSKGLKIGGRIDRIDLLSNGRIEIIDYKTGSNIPEQKKLDENLQLTVYGLALNHVKDPIFNKINKNPEDILFSLWYIDHDKKISTTRTIEQLEEAKSLLIQKAEEIASSDFLCSKNMLCNNCEYKILCSTIS